MAAPLHWADRLTVADVDGLIAHWAECEAWYRGRVAAQPFWASSASACRDRQRFWTEMRERCRAGESIAEHVLAYVARAGVTEGYQLPDGV